MHKLDVPPYDLKDTARCLEIAFLLMGLSFSAANFKASDFLNGS